MCDLQRNHVGRSVAIENTKVGEFSRRAKRQNALSVSALVVDARERLYFSKTGKHDLTHHRASNLIPKSRPPANAIGHVKPKSHVAAGRQMVFSKPQVSSESQILRADAFSVRAVSMRQPTITGQMDTN